MSKTKIIGINGSTRDGSNTLKALAAALEGARRSGAEVEIINLRDWALPIFVDDEDEADIVARFREKVYAADGLILASPEYHGTMSGAMKNALDYLGREEIENKAIGVVATSGSALGAERTLLALQQVGQKLRGWPVRTTASVPSASGAFEVDGDGRTGAVVPGQDQHQVGVRLRDRRLQEHLEQVGEEVAFLAGVLAEQRMVAR